MHYLPALQLHGAAGISLAAHSLQAFKQKVTKSIKLKSKK